MIVLAKLICKKHPKYKAQRVPRGKCVHCAEIWMIVDGIRRVSKHWNFRYGHDDTHPVIQL